MQIGQNTTVVNLSLTTSYCLSVNAVPLNTCLAILDKIV